MARVFVSFVYEDGVNYVHQLHDWERQGLLGQAKIVTEEEDRRQQGYASVKAYIRPIMHSCQGAIFLVGQDTHNRPWVDEEADHFLGAGKPIIVVRLPVTSGAPPPRLRHLPEIRFSSSAILTELRRYGLA